MTAVMTPGQSNLAAEIINRVVASISDKSLLSIQDYIRSEAARRAIPDLVEIPTIRAQQPDSAIATVLSPSQIKMFLDCQVKWWFRHGLGLPDVRSSFLGVGSAVAHATGASMAQKITTREDLPIGEVLGLFDGAWAEEKDKVVFDDQEDPNELGEQGAALTRLYMEKVAPTVQPAAVELKVEGEIGGVNVRGRVDILDEVGAIRDTKTSAKSPSKIDPMYRMQVAAYVPITPGASGVVGLDYLVKNKTPKHVPQEWRITGSDLRLVDEMYPLTQAAMRSGLYVPNRASFMCSRKMCPYWKACEAEYGGEVSGS